MKTLKVVPSVFFCVFRHAAFATHVHVYLWAVLLFISHMYYIIAALARCWLYDIICTCDHINDKIKAILQQLYPSESKMPPAYLFPNNRHFHCEGDIQSLSVHWLIWILYTSPTLTIVSGHGLKLALLWLACWLTRWCHIVAYLCQLYIEKWFALAIM